MGCAPPGPLFSFSTPNAPEAKNGLKHFQRQIQQCCLERQLKDRTSYLNRMADHLVRFPVVVLTVFKTLSGIAAWKTKLVEFNQNCPRNHQTSSCCNEVGNHNSLAFSLGPNGLFSLLLSRWWCWRSRCVKKAGRRITAY